MMSVPYDPDGTEGPSRVPVHLGDPKPFVNFIFLMSCFLYYTLCLPFVWLQVPGVSV